MSARRTAVWLAYWVVVLTVAALASIAAAMPFDDGDDATAAAITAAGLVSLAGLALEPNRKDHQ